jgi:hypothetical protein
MSADEDASHPEGPQLSPEEGPDGSGERRRSRLEALIPDLVRRVLREGADAISDDKIRETLLHDTVRRAVRAGEGAADVAEDQVRRILGELSLPKEAVDRITGRLDDYKGELLNLVAAEVHEFLEKIDVGVELQKLLTSLSFEITTEIRFIPNEKRVRGDGKGRGGALKPDVKADVKVKKAAGRRSRRSKQGADSAPESAEG